MCVCRQYFSRTNSRKTTVSHVRNWTQILTRTTLVRSHWHWSKSLSSVLYSFRSSRRDLFVSSVCFLLLVPLSSECSGSTVPSERETARGPDPCTVPGPWTNRRPQQQSGKCSQARALRGSCRGREGCPASSRRPSSFNSGSYCGPSPGTPPSQSTGCCPPARAAGRGGSGSHQTSLGHHPATELGLSGDKYPAVQPHHQLCQLTAQPQRSGPVTTD